MGGMLKYRRRNRLGHITDCATEGMLCGRPHNMPEMPRVFGRDDATFAGWFGTVCKRFAVWLLLEDLTNGGRPQMQACSGKCLSNFNLAQHGTKRFESLHDVASEVRELVDRLTELHECIGAFFIQSPHPRSH